MSGNGLFWSSFVRVFGVFPLSFFITTVRIFISLQIFMPVFSFSLGVGVSDMLIMSIKLVGLNAAKTCHKTQPSMIDIHFVKRYPFFSVRSFLAR